MERTEKMKDSVIRRWRCVQRWAVEQDLKKVWR